MGVLVVEVRVVGQMLLEDRLAKHLGINLSQEERKLLSITWKQPLLEMKQQMRSAGD